MAIKAGCSIESCERPHALGKKYCRECHNAYMREWRKTHPLSGEAKKKDNARSYARLAEKRGQIKRKPCEVCGEHAERHHDDYDKPLDIRWLCTRHHREHHRREKVAAQS